MRVRSLALRLHFFVGVVSGGALVVLGLSGAVLVFRPELDAALRLEEAPAASGASPVPLESLVDAARHRHPGFRVTGLLLPDQRSPAARVGMLDHEGGAAEVLIHPVSGKVLGSFWIERSPLHALRLLHAELYMGSRGSAIVGGLGLLLLLQGLTGLYLWWPLMRRPRRGLHVRWSRPWPVVGRDLHKLLGAGSILFHLPIVATGGALGLSALLPQATAVARASAQAAALPRLPFDALARAAEAALPGGRVAALRIQTNGAVVVTMRMRDDPGQRGSGSVVLDGSDGRVLHAQDVRHESWTGRILVVARAIHLGEVGGIALRLVYVLGGLASVLLALSGYVLAFAAPRGLGAARAASP